MSAGLFLRHPQVCSRKTNEEESREKKTILNEINEFYVFYVIWWERLFVIYLGLNLYADSLHDEVNVWDVMYMSVCVVMRHHTEHEKCFFNNFQNENKSTNSFTSYTHNQ